jgi:hypothetical protein
MHTLKRIALVTAAIVVTTTGCDSRDGDGAAANAREVCGHFAQDADVASALSQISRTERFLEGGSQRKRTLAELRAADGKTDNAEELQGSPLCVLKSTDGDRILSIYFRDAAAVSRASTENEKTFTFYDTGQSAMATDRLASIYFRCRMPGSERSIIMNGTLERENKVDISGKRAAGQQMLVLNAAARQVVNDLRCDGAELSEGPPAAVSGVYAGE